MSSKIDRKALKRPDYVLTRLRGLYAWVEDNLKTVATAAIVIFVCVSGGIFIEQYFETQEKNALNSFYKAKKSYDEKRQALDKAEQDKTKDKKKKNKIEAIDTFREVSQELFELKSVTQAHPKTKAALLSYLTLAKVHREFEKNTEAVTYYEDALRLSKHHFYKILALYNLGYLNEEAGHYQKAIDWFKQITEFKNQRILLWTVGYRPNSFWVSSAYFGMARCYEKLNKKTLAKDNYLKVSDEFPDTPYADQAKTYAQHIQ